jgi:hypothetical protein
MNIGEIQVPNFGATLAQGQQQQASKLQQLAMLRELQGGQAVDAILGNGGAAALFGADPAARESVLSQLAGTGSAGVRLALPVLQQQQQREVRLSPEEVAAAGYRPGTVVMRSGTGTERVSQAPDTHSPEREAQALREARAMRQPQTTWRDERDESGTLIGQRSSTGQFNPVADPGISMPRAQAFVTRFAEDYANGTLPPDRTRMFETSLAIVSQPRPSFDPQTGQMVALPPTIPDFLRDAVARRRAGGQPQPAAAPPGAVPEPAAPAPAAAPAPGGVPIGNTGLVATPPAAPLPGDTTVRQVAPPRPAQPGEPSGEERLSSGFAQRMQLAEQTLGQVTRGGYEPGGLRDNLAARSPVGNYFMSAEGQQYRQAQEDWVRAKLRKESGAVIADDEMQREIETYFPQIGEGEGVRKQKAAARATALRAMSTASGRAHGKVNSVSGWGIKSLDDH